MQESIQIRGLFQGNNYYMYNIFEQYDVDRYIMK
jgi:hypothetical protein